MEPNAPPVSLPPADDVHITDKVFIHCYHKIRDWLNIPAMQGHLMKYGLLVTAQDMHFIGSSISPWDKVQYVYKKACSMKDGFHLLYLSIRESQDQHMGHKDAADELEECAREQGRATATSSLCSSASSTTSYAPSTAPSSTISSSTTPSSSSFPPPHPQQRAPSNYQPGNMVTPAGSPAVLEDRSCSSLESMVAVAGGAGRLAGGRRGVGQRPTSIDRSRSNEERTHILKNYSPMLPQNTRGPIRQESAVADLDPEVELDQGSGVQRSPSPSLSSFRRDSDSSVQEIVGRECEEGSSLPSIHDLLARGDTETLYKCYYSNGYDIEFADSQLEAQLFPTIARFLVAILNGRDRERVGKGILIAGVNVNVNPVSITGVTTNQDNFLHCLREVLKERVGIHGDERELSDAELGCVEHEFVASQREATLLCVSISPSWEASEGSLYYCREGEGRWYWRQVAGGCGQLLFHRVEEHAAALQSLWQQHNT